MICAVGLNPFVYNGITYYVVRVDFFSSIYIDTYYRTITI